MTRTLIVPEPDELAAVMRTAFREHEIAHHNVKDPVPVPDECARDVAVRMLAMIVVAELQEPDA